ncbi:AbrB/MazE/SpoVT family DNA-binding domain-containing protein [Pelagibacterium lacus]|uniref:AbrB/MazE/SpoVT family DNA-binding domain-containing protein n=1 Tax=Pelagibacterium lacus TaxID=2282655 RepID=A0A369W499_9HYPH|nr:AbrB/MazE/SpoVT family DNA-binding domain-containing protein [Pelagibacterium lacus]RDE08160.1 AbrB/MazE/SpoVT family DNA-binding domain-containing protein [Pelagibacterium lacus]
MSTATLTSKGQMTLPKEIREDLNLKAGDKVDFVKVGGRYELRPRNLRAADFAGMLHRPGMRAMSVEEMDEGIAEAVRERSERSLDRD